jgi:tRNA 2-selenouridine synthase
MICTAPEFADLAGRMTLVDVRSPGEYARGHIPGAVSMPLFSDAERHVVGLTYAHVGKDAAVKVGLELVGPKLRSFVEDAESFAPGREVLVYCWRGGMRSGSLSWLLATAGFTVRTLQGGYKAWRRYARSLFEEQRRYVVVGGATGSGKTKLLQSLEEAGEAVLDLERDACHRGSAFGRIGQSEQPTQEHFENRVAYRLHHLRTAKYIWMEDESRGIGKVEIPEPLWKQLLAAPVFHMRVPTEHRVANLVEDYGNAPSAELNDALSRIARRLRPEYAREAFAALSEGRTDRVAELCLEYYDKYYARSIDQREPRNIFTRTYTTFDLPVISVDARTIARQIVDAHNVE